MNTAQIDYILKHDKHVAPIFRGVFAKDKLPCFKYGAYVVNTDTSKDGGSHWVAIFATHDRFEYFDSYGGEPLPELKQWGKGRKWAYNPIPLQSPFSAVCGQYCIYYLVFRARGLALRTILLDFGKDPDFNDKIVYDFVNDCYYLEGLKLLDTDGLITQLARARMSLPSIRKLVSGQ